MQLKRVIRAEAGGSRPSRLQKCPALLVWRARVCGTGMGFYILWPHTAAFSKQSTIIQSDKRANTEHSRVKKKHVPPLFVNSCLPASLCFFVFSHIVALSLVPPCSFTASILLLSRQQHWGTFSICTCNDVRLQLLQPRQIFIPELVSSVWQFLKWLRSVYLVAEITSKGLLFFYSLQLIIWEGIFLITPCKWNSKGC